MKKTIFCLTLCVVCIRVGAQTMAVADVEALPGETVGFTLDLTGGQAERYTALQFDAQFPATGFNTSGDYVVSPMWKNATSTINTLDDNGRGTIPVASSEAISAADVKGLLTVYFTVGSDVPLGEYEVTLTNLWLGYGTDSKDYLNDVTFKVNVVAMHTVVLDENATEAPLASDGEVNVRVRRTMKAGQWSTICLPFAMTADQVKEAFGDDVQLADFTGCDTEEDDDDNTVGITVKFETASEIEANHPYIIKVSEPVAEFTVNGVEIEPEDEPSTRSVALRTGSGTKKDPYVYFYDYFTGTYVANTTLPAVSLFLSGNKFWYSTGATQMKAYRAYFELYFNLTDVEEAYSEVKMAFDIDGEATATDEIVNGRPSDCECYDLGGRRVGKPQQRGVYIVDGRKVAITK